jgi:magnesium transporter
MVSAVVVASFEEQLERNVLIAVFVPAVVYMADAVGTQTETVLIRAMASGVTARNIARREIGSGVAIGVVVASAFFLFALTVWGDAAVATAVALALVASCSIASLVALVLPAAIRHFGRDPAFGAGPLATVIQDLLSVIVYLVIASAIAA